MATNPLSRTSTDATAITRGEIAARIDRLPLTRIQYGYAAITFLGPLLISNLFVWTAANGMNQRGAVLEQIST